MQDTAPPAADAGFGADAASTRQEEWRTFLFLAYVMAPALAVVVVGAYGFAVWMFQLFTGQLPTG